MAKAVQVEPTNVAVARKLEYLADHPDELRKIAKELREAKA